MNRTSVVTCTLVLSLVACDLLKKKDADAGAEAGVTTIAPTDTAVVAAADAGPATPLKTATTAKPVAAKPSDAGADSGAVAAADGGALAIASTAADAGAVQQCCCKIGKALSYNGQSECTTTLKGACVKKEECEAKSCCCKIGDVKSKKLQTECSLTKGTCVKKDECK